MDARPQRPLRSLHIAQDENAAPAPSKNLHQRHKSTGALSTLLGAGGLKMAAKRSAFVDVSNVAKNVGARDDLVATGKNTDQDSMQKVNPLSEKPSALLRPAQRPLNPAGAKLSNNKENVANTSAPATIQQSNIEVSQTQSTKPRTFLKRSSTAIFKDNSSEDQAGVQVSAAGTASRPVHQSLGPRQHKSQPQLKQDAPVLRRTQSKAFTSADAAEPKQEKPVARLAVVEDSVYESSAEVLVEEHDSRPAIIDDEQVHESKAVAAVREDFDRQERELPPLPPMSEPEEYWEEEEEDEIYDEQGFTTAHSYRSRGDNTTGGATTILFPKVTNKIKRELEHAKEIVENSRTAEEIEDEAWDTSMVAEYGDEIFAYMRELELKMLPNAHYMDNQAEIQWSMRSVLMDWLIQVHHRFSLLPETLFLCVNYIDRFLSCKIVSLGKLQLVGATAIFVAAKYEEINCPSVGEIVYMVDGGYTVDEILKAERFMLSMLQFELGWPGPMSFLRRISKADDYDLETRTLAKYFLEVTVMDERFVGSPPSYTAAGSHCLARLMLRKGDWSTSHVYYSGYTYAQLRPLISMVFECLIAPEKHHAAVYDKYADKRYKRASHFVQGKMEQGFIIPPVERYYRPSISPAETSENPFSYNNSLVDAKA